MLSNVAIIKAVTKWLFTNSGCSRNIDAKIKILVMEVIRKFLNSGISDGQPDYLKQKIKLSNGIALYFVGMVGIYIAIFIVLMPQLLPYAILSGLLYLSVPFLNRNKLFDLSRFIAATNPAFISFIVHISIIREGESPFASNYMIQVSFLLLPWILFDFRDKGLLFTTFILTVLFLVLVRPLNGLIEPVTIDEMTRSVTMEYISMITACVIIGVTLYIMQTFNAAMQKENELLISMADKKNEELKGNEQKLNDYISQIEGSRIEDKKREWSSNGIAKFADILRQNNNDVSETYDSIILNIVKYMGANQGGLFIVEEEGTDIYLEIKACYAFSRKKFINKRIIPGEGLVGQCYLERDTMYLTEVPKNYVAITSGLGDAIPRSILIIPLIVNEEIYGVIELASFKKFEDHEIEFLQKIGESIAATVSNLKISEKTKHLLSTSMQQTEEMRAQEEEMRQNMEELSATQEELARKSNEIEQIRVAEKASADEQINEQKRLIEQYMANAQNTERELIERIAFLEGSGVEAQAA
jgi:GAF domain-containing protein